LVSFVHIFTINAQNIESNIKDNEIVLLNESSDANSSTIRIRALKPFISTVYELPNPRRIVVDIADIKISSSVKNTANFPYKYSIESIQGANPTISRFEFNIENFDSYSANSDKEELIVNIIRNNTSTSSVQKNLEGEKNIKLNTVNYKKSDNNDIVKINASDKISKYTSEVSTSKSKYQLQIDIDNISVSGSSLGTIFGGGIIDKITTATRGSGLRITILSTQEKPFNYNIEETITGLDVVLSTQVVINNHKKNNNKDNSISSQLPDINPLDSKISPQAREQQMQDAFNFSGYNKDRITVEFQKMDLHNVFSFLRQVSGVNLVVDESVQGTLTLVLDDVPWDFALDIILNLKGLEKEERFNTIVIYPKGKGFLWPEQAEKNLSFEADSSVIEKEALVVQQQEKQSPDRVEAKEIIARALSAEGAENFENAVTLYEEAFEKWNNNTQLANKISSIYLVQLRQNAKSLYYAQKALTIEPNNDAALLQAGIASASMQNISQAEHFFSQSVRGTKPSKEAFLNYAAFKEEHKEYKEALTLLDQHDKHFSKSMDSMLAAARVNDKMGNSVQAVRHYRELVNSGFRIPPDLSKFIQDRIAH
jgi:type IV pilus assembly protein PilQ